MRYKIMLLCVSGMSTNILMKKLDKYASENSIEPSVEAVGLPSISYLGETKKYGIILMGLQISYHIDEVKKTTGKSVEAINPTDYVLGNAKKIFEQAKKLKVQVK